MAAIAPSDVTIVLLPTRGTAGVAHHPGYIIGKQRQQRFRMEIPGNGDLTYPSSGGIPLPTWGATVGNGDLSFGMYRNLDSMIFEGHNGGATVEAAGNTLGAIDWQFRPGARALHGFWDSRVTSTANAAPTHHAELPTTWKTSMTSGDGIHFYFMAIGW